MTVTALALAAVCSWNNPGVSPYMGDVVAAVDRYTDIPVVVRQQLKTKMLGRQYDDLAEISKFGIIGDGSYHNLRDMHFGNGVLCNGTVDTSGWSNTHRERGLVYCVDDYCLIVPTVCRNVSRVDKRPVNKAFPHLPVEETFSLDPVDMPLVQVVVQTEIPINSFTYTSSPIGERQKITDVSTSPAFASMAPVLPISELSTLWLTMLGLCAIAAFRSKDVLQGVLRGRRAGGENSAGLIHMPNLRGETSSQS